VSKTLIPLDISTSKDLLQLAEEVESSGVGRVLQRGGQPVAVLQPLGKSVKRRRPPTFQPEDDPLLGIIGIGASAGPSNIAEMKDEYISEAIEDWKR
jgi:hypothetical protein